MPKYAALTLRAQISIEAPPGRAIKVNESWDSLQEQIRAQAIALGTREELGETGDLEKSLRQGGKAR